MLLLGHLISGTSAREIQHFFNKKLGVHVPALVKQRTMGQLSSYTARRPRGNGKTERQKATGIALDHHPPYKIECIKTVVSPQRDRKESTTCNEAIFKKAIDLDLPCRFVNEEPETEELQLFSSMGSLSLQQGHYAKERRRCSELLISRSRI